MGKLNLFFFRTNSFHALFLLNCFGLLQCEEVAAALQAGGAIASEKTLADVEPKYAAAKE